METPLAIVQQFVWDAILPILAEHQDRPIRVLHYACNVGGTTEAIAERLAFVTGGQCNVLGIDPSPENIGIALRAMYATPINERAAVGYMAGETSVLARETFHAIFSTHHVDHADHVVLREFVRLLARPGVVCFPFSEPERGAMANRLLVDFCDVTISDDPVTGDRARWATAVIR